MIIEFILVILIIAIFGKIYGAGSNITTGEKFMNINTSYPLRGSQSEANKFASVNYHASQRETPWGVGTPFAKGLSNYQTDDNEPPSSQILKPNTMPNSQSKRDIQRKLNKINEISDAMDYDKFYSDVVKDAKNKLDRNGNPRKRKKHRKNKNVNTMPCKKINKFFIESQFNNSYRDVLTVFNNICPDQKMLFNLQALPVTATRFTTEETPFQFVKLISQFINRSNEEINKLPDSYEIVNNYNNYMPLTSQLKKYTENKGINIFYKSIGVDFNLYPDLPENAPIELIDIVSMTKEFTESETKYITTFVVKKLLESVTDQLRITVHFIVKNDPLDTCNMFEMCTPAQDINSYQKVAIEFIFIDGYYTNDFNVDYDCIDSCEKSKKVSNIDSDNQYYSYAELGKDHMLDRGELIKEFNNKLRQHDIEMNNFDINVPYPIYEGGETKIVNPRNNF